MKILKSTSAIAVALLIFNACSKENTGSVNPESQLSADYTLVDFDELEAPQISDGLTTDFMLENPEKHFDQTPCNRPAQDKSKCDGKEKQRPGDGRHELGGVLKRLDLNAEQRESIGKFMHQHCMCIAEHLKKSNQINREVIATFNQKRGRLIKAFKANEISRQEFGEKLKDLKAELGQELRKNNDKRMQMEMMRKCEGDFLHKVASVLDARQAEIFKTWLAKHK